MPKDVQSKSRSLLGVSDLTLVATIRRGLIPALDSRSYQSRLGLLLKTLMTLRISSLEAQPTPLISDAVDRIRAIHSFRLAMIDPERPRLLLAVTFDGAWESYMRRIWRDLGPLLDVIFCNCEDYRLAHTHSFAEYSAWVRSAQVNTDFFYNAAPLTVQDLHYLRERERFAHDGTPPPQAQPADMPAQALPALTALYRLTDMYTPGSEDGACLLRAARHLLRDFVSWIGQNTLPVGHTATECAALRWFKPALNPAVKPDPPGPAVVQARHVQSGILQAHGGVTHGCLLLIRLEDAAAARRLLAYLRPRIVSAADQPSVAGELFMNVSLTLAGLRAAGVDEATLSRFPQEFLEGMAARAGILGDHRHNHPTRWALPERNWNAPPGERVQLSSVHAVVQLSGRFPRADQWHDLPGDPQHPLAEHLRRFAADLEGGGIRILSVQAMQRRFIGGAPSARGHFDFADGISQPILNAPARDPYSDAVAAGDLLLGYENSLGDPAVGGVLWKNSSFLVIRKLRQDVPALAQALVPAQAQAPGPLPLAPGAPDALELLMGRRRDGRNLVDGREGNNFDFEGQGGLQCPVHSHVRRANPRRTRPDDLPTIPRLVRRGMSYGPSAGSGPNDAERGLLFMAYNASIAEQFEVIQAWLAGGNSGGATSYSGLRDPWLGVPQDLDPHHHVEGAGGAGAPARWRLDPPSPLVRLQWGMYLYVPSLPALDELTDLAAQAECLQAATGDAARRERDEQRRRHAAAQAQMGAAVIGLLRRLEQAEGPAAATTKWKTVLEDLGARMSGTSRAVWTAIRELHGGVLKTPYGVLVCSRSRVMEVFDNRQGLYTATGYAERMRQSFGEIYLGMDDGPRYRAESEIANRTIQQVRLDEAFDSAFATTTGTLRDLKAGLAPGEGRTVDVKDIVDEVLARFCAEWFGVPDGQDIAPGGWHWREDVPPTCPGHFHSPSRYMFQPNPGAEAAETGQRHGQALQRAVWRHVQAVRGQGASRGARLGRAFFDAVPYDNELLTRILIGALMGFLPTVDGNLRGTLFEWIDDRSLWDHQIALRAAPGQTALARAQQALLAPLRRALKLRPVPELVWRKALVRHELGAVTVVPGDTVVLSIVSAMHERLDDDADPHGDDLYPLFGGRREDGGPTHACPGYAMALGVMLGVLAGMLESERLEPTLTPMALRLIG